MRHRFVLPTAYIVNIGITLASIVVRVDRPNVIIANATRPSTRNIHFLGRSWSSKNQPNPKRQQDVNKNVNSKSSESVPKLVFGKMPSLDRLPRTERTSGLLDKRKGRSPKRSCAAPARIGNR